MLIKAASPEFQPLAYEPISELLTRAPTGVQPILTERHGHILDTDWKQVDEAAELNMFNGAALRLSQTPDPIFRKPHRNLIDIGSGDLGSPFADALERNVPGTTLWSIDRQAHLLGQLHRPESVKIAADAVSLPFPDHTFDIGVINCIFWGPISKDRQKLTLPNGYELVNEGDPTSFEILKEAARIIVPGGLLILSVTVGCGSSATVLSVLNDAGYISMSHLIRFKTELGFHDDYVLRTTC